jgi:hypothetical protein
MSRDVAPREELSMYRITLSLTLGELTAQFFTFANSAAEAVADASQTWPGWRITVVDMEVVQG